MDSDISIYKAVQTIVQKHAFEENDSIESLELYLKSWWSKTYNRPLKDPTLQEYTLFELLYEYHDKIERENAKEFKFEQETDKIEDEKEKEVLDWAEEEEKKEKEVAEAKKKKDEEWMLEQLKKEHGDDFGEDLDIGF